MFAYRKNYRILPLRSVICPQTTYKFTVPQPIRIKKFFPVCDYEKHLIDCSLVGPKILVFGSHSSANLQLILDCFIPNFKFKYENSENIKADGVNTVVLSVY